MSISTMKRKLIQKALGNHVFLFDNQVCLSVDDLWKVLEETICSNPTCENDARYSSGYCGICDIQFNEGNGERIE